VLPLTLTGRGCDRVLRRAKSHGHPTRHRHPAAGETHRENHGQQPKASREARCMSNAFSRCPIGVTENSPAFQRWVNAIKLLPSPVGTAEDCELTQTMMHHFKRPQTARIRKSPSPFRPPLDERRDVAARQPSIVLFQSIRPALEISVSLNGWRRPT
jgi:hypothetical protein